MSTDSLENSEMLFHIQHTHTHRKFFCWLIVSLCESYFFGVDLDNWNDILLAFMWYMGTLNMNQSLEKKRRIEILRHPSPDFQLSSRFEPFNNFVANFSITILQHFSSIRFCRVVIAYEYESKRSKPSKFSYNLIESCVCMVSMCRSG